MESGILSKDPDGECGGSIGWLVGVMLLRGFVGLWVGVRTGRLWRMMMVVAYCLRRCGFGTELVWPLALIVVEVSRLRSAEGSLVSEPSSTVRNFEQVVRFDQGEVLCRVLMVWLEVVAATGSWAIL